MKVWFGRKKKEIEALSKLQKMSQSTWRCRTCELEHSGIVDLGMSSPSVWKGEENIQPNSDLSLDGDFLSEDFCIINGENYIVRGVLNITVEGLDKDFGFGVWSSLSKDNFEKYVAGFDDGIDAEGPPWSSWFCSHLGYFGKTVGEKAWVTAQPNRQRPHITLMDEASVLGKVQRHGMAASTLIEIFEYYGNHLPD